MTPMSHDAQIGAYHTANDLHLIPATKLLVAPPQPRRITVDVPGRSGRFDLYRTVTGTRRYDNREGNWNFYIDTDGWRSSWGTPGLYTAYHKIGALLGAQNTGPNAVTVHLDDDPAFIYKGRVWMVNDYAAAQNYSKITLKYKLYPYKELAKPLEEDWLWDELNFECDLAPQPFGRLELAPGEVRRVQLPPCDRDYSEVLITLLEGKAHVDTRMCLGKDYETDATNREEWSYDLPWNNVSSANYTLLSVSNDPFYDNYEIRLQNKSTTEKAVFSIQYQPKYL